jgi:hypothetical protein
MASSDLNAKSAPAPAKLGPVPVKLGTCFGLARIRCDCTNVLVICVDFLNLIHDF